MFPAFHSSVLNIGQLVELTSLSLSTNEPPHLGKINREENGRVSFTSCSSSAMSISAAAVTTPFAVIAMSD